MSARTGRGGVLALVVGLALVLSACGGDDEDPPKTPTADPTVSEAVLEYRDAAAEVCGPAIEEMKEIADGLTVEGSTKAEQDAVLAEVGQAFLDEVAALRKIDAPDEIAADVDAWLDSMEAAARKVKNRGTALLTGGTPPFADAEARADALGVPGCVTPPQ